MKSIRNFVRRRILWVGLLAVLLPLACILALQYWSLLKLEKASTVADQVRMRNYLDDVYKEIKYFYRTNSEILNVKASAVAPELLRAGRSPFCNCPVEGARRLFITMFQRDGHPQVTLYDPASFSVMAESPAAEVRAVNLATASWQLRGYMGEILSSPTITYDGQDLNNRIIYKPITNESWRVIGVAGMILDETHFREQLLPRAIQTSLLRFFPDRAHESVIVAAQDERKNIVFATHEAPGQNNVEWTSLPYFPEWHLSIRSNGMTPKQWARWNFGVNLSLSLFLTLALIGGIAVTLRGAARELKLSQMKTDFVSNVSHELRTPLSSVRVFGEFLRLGRVTDQQKIREYGEYIETESRRLTQLINNILDFSRIESGGKTYHFEPADARDVVAETLKTLDVRLKQSGFAVNFHAPAKPLPPVLMDTDAIAQAFMNLLDNAVKYSGEAREIDVRLEERAGFIALTVTDRGLGIPASEQEKIFEKFYRVSTGLVHDVKGNGLGLSIVKHIAEAHKGSVTVRSEVGRGSSFTILLPVAPRTEDERGTPAKETRQGNAQPLALNSTKAGV